jgi:hypothetical protein
MRIFLKHRKTADEARELPRRHNNPMNLEKYNSLAFICLRLVAGAESNC